MLVSRADTQYTPPHGPPTVQTVQHTRWRQGQEAGPQRKLRTRGTPTLARGKFAHAWLTRARGLHSPAHTRPHQHLRVASLHGGLWNATCKGQKVVRQQEHAKARKDQTAYERKDWSNLACARREDPCWSAALDSHAVKSNTGPQWRCPPGHASWCQSLRQKAEAPTGRPGDAGHRCVTEPRHPKFTQTCTACLADPRKFADSKTLHAARSRAAGTTGGSHHCGVCAALGFNCSCIAACS